MVCTGRSLPERSDPRHASERRRNRCLHWCDKFSERYGKSSAFATESLLLERWRSERTRIWCQRHSRFSRGDRGGIDDIPLGEEREVKAGMLDSRSIARVVAQAVAQPRDTWVHEFDIRPSVEQF